MPDVTNSSAGIAANGTATPATATLSVAAAGLVICVIAALGTSPTIGLPTGGGTWTQIQLTNGAALSVGVFMRPGGTGGSISPSSVLGGTVTGWVMTLFEFGPTGGANCGLQGSNQIASSLAQLTNIFPTSGQTLPNALYVYSVARATATLTAQNTSIGPLSIWSASLRPQAGVQGLSLDFYWLSTLGQGANQPPAASGLLSGAVASVATGAWFNTLATQPSNNDNVDGQAGVYVPVQYAGMIGG